MPAAYLTAFEYDRLPVGDGGIDASEVEELVRLNAARPGFCERRHQSVRLAQFCGVVRIGRRALEVLPKVDRGDSAETCRRPLLHMLQMAGRFPMFPDREVGHSLVQGPLLEVFIWAFLSEVAGIVRAGVLRRYEVREEDIRTIRGAIITSRQFGTLGNRGDLVACRFDELTDDNEWNRLIKWGLRAVRPWITSMDLYARWTELAAVFQEISDVTEVQFDRLIFDRSASRYRAAITWVKWIAASLAPSIRAGGLAAPGLLFDMNALFQASVAALLRRRAWGTGLSVTSPDSTRYLASLAQSSRNAFRLRPDLAVRRAGKVVAIADTKWKRIGLRGGTVLYPEESDVYQMLAYATSYQCTELALIYPWYGDLGESQETTYELPVVGGVQPRLTIICVDIRTPEFDVVRGDPDCIAGLLRKRGLKEKGRPLQAA